MNLAFRAGTASSCPPQFEPCPKCFETAQFRARRSFRIGHFGDRTEATPKSASPRASRTSTMKWARAVGSAKATSSARLTRRRTPPSPGSKIRAPSKTAISCGFIIRILTAPIPRPTLSKEPSKANNARASCRDSEPTKKAWARSPTTRSLMANARRAFTKIATTKRSATSTTNLGACSIGSKRIKSTTTAS